MMAESSASTFAVDPEAVQLVAVEVGQRDGRGAVTAYVVGGAHGDAESVQLAERLVAAAHADRDHVAVADEGTAILSSLAQPNGDPPPSRFTASPQRAAQVSDRGEHDSVPPGR
jgi:hypothetical protein